MDSTNAILGNEKRVLGRILGGDETGEPVSENVGDWIGPYRLMERLGEGGFGIVWRAEQTDPVKREVALKVIKRGMDTMQVLARFTQERQALAGMDHPGIAALLDAGASVDGRPFFAMELVNGEPITDWCERRRSPIHERLRLFTLVCNAVQHAHQKGIIHRDLKPSNILVANIDSLPTPKIIDFGIAKAIHKTGIQELSLVTRQNQVVGTPLYMSPEQLDGGEEIDTRSDIYSLGVLLYELLTGTQPFTSGSGATEGMEGIKRRIREVPPERPSTLMRTRKRLDGDLPPIAPPFDHAFPSFSSDLDWITMCALEKERHRRYQSATELAADLRRFLNNEPVLARPPSFTYVTGRWIKRHRTAFLAACLVILAMITGTAVALWQATLARAAQRVAEQQAKTAAEERAKAVAETTRAVQASKFITDLLDRVSAEVAKGRNPEALRYALADSGERINDLSDDHELRIQLLERVADLYLDLGETKLMLPLIKQHADEMSQLHGASSEKALNAELDYIRMVVDFGTRANGPGLLEDLSQRVETAQGRSSKLWFEVQRQLVRSLVKLEAKDRALAAADTYLSAAKTAGLRGKSILTVNLACSAALELAGEFDRAEALIFESLKLAIEFDGESRIPLLHNQLIHIYESKKDYKSAVKLLLQIVADLKKKHGERSPEILARLNELCEFERRAGFKGEALKHADEAVSIAREPETPRGTKVQTMIEHSRCHSALGQLDEAIEAGFEALKEAQDEGKAKSVQKCILNLAELHRSAHKPEESASYYLQLIEEVEATHANFKDALDMLDIVLSIRMEQPRPDEALNTALRLWSCVKKWTASIDGPMSASDSDYVRTLAGHAMNAFKLYQSGNPDAPAPPQVKEWEAAMKGAEVSRPVP